MFLSLSSWHWWASAWDLYIVCSFGKLYAQTISNIMSHDRPTVSWEWGDQVIRMVSMGQVKFQHGGCDHGAHESDMVESNDFGIVMTCHITISTWQPWRHMTSARPEGHQHTSISMRSGMQLFWVYKFIKETQQLKNKSKIQADCLVTWIDNNTESDRTGTSEVDLTVDTVNAEARVQTCLACWWSFSCRFHPVCL